MKKFLQKWNLFLRWWLFFMLMAVGAAVLISQGILVTIFIVDFTKICFLIYALFFGKLIS
jgi:hypothetical protein